ncbi:MAG TPA: acetylxylan esterase [Microbacteriaceae bacterium]|jgi:cephalosporin-C deacetylase|nr:acetylxylan esterase [Microbacteriaceae bacterium]
MPFTDLPLDALREYKPQVSEPSDFDAFWSQTIADARSALSAPVLTPVRTPISEIEIFDLTFSGFAGDPIKGWVMRPRGSVEPRATVVEYVGYNGGRGLPGEKLLWAASGYVHVVMDTRGQGSGWGTGGDTPDPHGSGPASAGFMTRGIEHPNDYYYRRVYTDAVRLIDHVRQFDFVDPERLAVTGASQGGGIALAVAGLVDGLAGVMPDVPFLSHFRRAVELTPEPPFTEIVRYLAVHRGSIDRVFETLSYFDGVNFARRVHAPALFSVALMDGIVLPSTVFAAFNALPTQNRSIEVYPFNGHEGGQTEQWIRQADWLTQMLG